MFFKGLGLAAILALFNQERIINWALGKNVLPVNNADRTKPVVLKAQIPSKNQHPFSVDTFNNRVITSYGTNPLKGPTP